ncbi:hypothetical protein BHE90_003406 [Fusarium euwallaceae]|uniref:Uncharacterized protein n=1 Tax=Fusarium euwallaceae TaxID=1147111 RepID=A0A430M286_9HYPO|nr:hypothetical protein BHE90_003406 [Fusarium euwallaceae]
MSAAGTPLSAGSDSPLTDPSSTLTDLDMTLLGADYSDNEAADGEESGNHEPDDNDDGFAKPWSREDAIDRLDLEFWMHHPNCEPEENSHSSNGIHVGPDHPQFHLYARIHGLVNKYYDELDREGESNMVGETKDQVQHARNAFHTNGYGINGKYWSKLLPDQAEMMLPRFIDPHGDMDGAIAGSLATMGRGWMLSINGKEVGNDSVTARNNSNDAASVASQVPSILQRIEGLEGHLVLVRDQAVAKVKELDEKLLELDVLTKNHQADLEYLKPLVRNNAKKRRFEPSGAGYATDDYTDLFSENKKGRLA